MKMREVVFAKCLTAEAYSLELIKNNKRKTNIIVLILTNWVYKNDIIHSCCRALGNK
jgi:hypothetical protein